METCSYSHSSPKRSLCDVGSLDVLLKDFMPEKGKDAMDLPSQRVLMKLILFHCLANTSDRTPLPLVTENDDTPLEERKLQYSFRPTWSAHQKRSNLGSSKPHSNSQLPNLNIKRKRFSQPTATADPERVSLLQGEPEPEASAARKIIPRVKLIPPKKPGDMGSSSSASSIATADPEKASLLQDEPKPEASAAPKTVPRLKIIPPKKPPHLGSTSASPIAIPNDSASALSKEKSPIHKPKRQRINPTRPHPHPDFQPSY